MERKQAAVWFSDISGSADELETYGEEGATKRIRACRRVVGDAILAEGGEIHPVGDRLVAIFATADALVTAGSKAHNEVAVRAAASRSGREPLRLRSGAAFGTVVTDETGGLVGEVMTVAARICDLARPDQFFVTKTLMNRITASLTPTRVIGAFPVRGKTAKLEVLEILWSEEGLTARAPRAVADADVETWAELRFGGQVVRLGPDKLTVTLGRETTNDVVVTDRAVSREHAEVVHRSGRNYLVDRSTNGTYLRPGRRKPHHLHRDELMLEGEGTFALGRADGPEISYRIL